MGRFSIRFLATSFVLACLSLPVATPVAAQEPALPATTLGELVAIVGPGDRVEVTTTSGFEERGEIEMINDRVLRLSTESGLRDFDENDLLEVRRQADGRSDGAAIGALIGLGIGALACAREGSERGLCVFVAGVVLGAPIGAVLGMAVDGSVSNRDVLYLRSQASRGWKIEPVIRRGAYGARFALRF
jgi:hypothetical protein